MPGRLRERAVEKNDFGSKGYNSSHGTPGGAKDISTGEYSHNVGEGENYSGVTKSPSPSKSVKDPVK